MPDIDKLLELSGLLGVSVNELLSGERLETREELAEKADENLAEILRGSDTFGLADRMEYFRHKWISEHRLALVLTVLFYLAAAVAMGIWARPMFPIGCVALAVVLWCFTRNKMMAYVEARAFKKCPDSTSCSRLKP